MKSVHNPKNGKTDTDENSPAGLQESIHPFPDELNISDGGEFLDDALRMKEQPFEGPTKENE